MARYELRQTMDRTALIRGYHRLDDADREALRRKLVAALGKSQVITDRDQLLAYSYDATGERHFPDAVVLPQDREEVAAAVRVAQEAHAPIIGRGASTNLSGGTTPLVGGVVIAFTRMNQILAIDEARGTVRVQSGVVNADLQQALAARGFFYPPDPSSHRISTIGGNVAENSGGPHCVKYGVTTNHVLELDVVLADGSICTVPPVGLAPDLDLASLVIGSEGTLALVTEATLAIRPLPESTETLLLSFRGVEDATRTVSAIIAEGLTPAALELMDEESIKIVEAFVHAGYPRGAGAVLLIELDGSPRDVEADARLVQKVAERTGCLRFEAAHDAQQAANLWRGRRAHYGAAARRAPHLWVQDVTVPRPRLAEMMGRVLAIGEEQGLTIVTAAHAGDGNLHPSIPYDPSDAGQVARLKAADIAILSACVEMGGAITGEHGIGIDKAEYLPLMYNADELTVLGEIKRAFDPTGQLNPLKALWPANASSPATGEPGLLSFAPRSSDEVRELMRQTAASDTPITFRGQGRRSLSQSARTIVDMRGLDQIFDLDRDNLSVEVGAGIGAGVLARLLESEGVDLPTIEPFMDETVGGLVAANATTWRSGHGHGWRNFLLAAEWVDGRGRVLRFGRKTMKNVAGYDVAKVMVGSRGTLGALTRVTLKLRPRTPHIAFVTSGPLSWSQAYETSVRLLMQTERPEALLMVKPGGLDNWVIWCLFEGPSASRRASQNLGLAVDWHEGMEAWLNHERERLNAAYRAMAVRRYQRGVARDLDISRIGTGATVYLCPGAGWYEMMGAEDGESPSVGGDWADVTARVRAIFDPTGRLGD